MTGTPFQSETGVPCGFIIDCTSGIADGSACRVDIGISEATALSVSIGIVVAKDCTVPATFCTSFTGCVTVLQASKNRISRVNNRNLVRRVINSLLLFGALIITYENGKINMSMG